MLDSAGSVAFFRSPGRPMRNAGIEVVEALKVNLMRVFLRRMDLRQHRKMIMIDNYIAYTGSMNMVDPRFFKQDSGVGQWVDLMARMEGPVPPRWASSTPATGKLKPANAFFRRRRTAISCRLKRPAAHHSHHRLRAGFPEDLIHQALLTAAYSAREYLIMTTPTLFPAMTCCTRSVPPRSAVSTSALFCRAKNARCWWAGPAGPSLPNCWLQG
jgi:cardiolipin synthase